MIDSPNVALLVKQASALEGEEAKSRELILMLLGHSPAPFSRHQFEPGHITCTGLVLSRDRSRLLLVHHRRLDRWLLPGGHVEAEDGEIWEAARREVLEETGVPTVRNGPALLAGVDVHGIPPKRGEPFHLHHDLVFLFQATSEAVEVSPECRDVLWCAPAEFDRFDLPSNVRRAWDRSVRR